MSVRVLWPFAEVLRARGIDPAELTRHLGVTEDQLFRPDARIAHSAAVAMADHAVRITGTPHLGLEAAEHFLAMSEDLIEYMSMTSPTTLMATETHNRYARLVHDAADMRTEITADHVTSIYALTGVEMHRAAIDFSLGGMVVSFRRVSSEPPIIERVEFTYPRPDDVTPYERFFKAPLYFGAERNAVVFRRRGYERVPLRSDPKLHEILKRQVERLLADVPRLDSFSARVRAVLLERIAERDLAAARVAKQMGMSDSTLRHRLGAEGTSFSTLLDDVRRELACRCLDQSEETVSAIAERVGYGEIRTFSKAFKRWTGMSPTEYRRRAVRT